MPDLDAYRASQRPHSHDWKPIGPDHQWCPDCGATRPTPPPDDDEPTPAVLVPAPRAAADVERAPAA